MNGHDDGMPAETVRVRPAPPPGSRPSGWLRLGVGLCGLWVLAYVILPWASSLSPVRPVMEALAESGANASHYFYTQSEETALAQMYVRNVLAAARSGPRH